MSPPVRQVYEGGYRRVMLADGTPMPGQMALELPTGMTAVNEPETATRPARTRLVIDRGSTDVLVRLPLAPVAKSTQTSSASGGVVAARFILVSDYLAAATSVILYACIARTSGLATPLHASLHNEADDAEVRAGATASALGPQELELDVSTIIGAAKKFYGVRLWSDTAGEVSPLALELRFK